MTTLLRCAVLALTALVGVALGPPALAEVGERPGAVAGVNDRVSDLAIGGGRVFLAGRFSAAADPGGAAVGRGAVAAVDRNTGHLDRGFAPQVGGGEVRGIALSPDASRLYLVGSFSSVNGQPRRKFAAVDTGTGAVLPIRADLGGGRGEAVLAVGDRVYLGGTFTTVEGQPRSRLAAIAAGSGALDPRWSPRASGSVFDLASGGGRIYAAGEFTSIDGVTTRRLAALDPQTGAVLPGFRGRADAPVFAVDVAGDSVYAALGGRGGRCSSYTAGSGSLAWEVRFNGNAQSVAVLGDRVYCGGHFGQNVDPKFPDVQRRQKLAAISLGGALSGSFTPRVNSALGVWALAADPATGTLWAGGDFTSVNGVRHERLARFS